MTPYFFAYDSLPFNNMLNRCLSKPCPYLSRRFASGLLAYSSYKLNEMSFMVCWRIHSDIVARKNIFCCYAGYNYKSEAV